MLLKTECHSNGNITQNGMTIKMECPFEMDCHSKWNAAQNEISLKWIVTQYGMSHKMQCHSKWNVTQNKMSLKKECNSNKMSQ